MAGSDGRRRAVACAGLPARFLFAGLAGQGNFANFVMTDRGGPTFLLPMPYRDGMTIAARNAGQQPIAEVGVQVSFDKGPVPILRRGLSQIPPAAPASAASSKPRSPATTCSAATAAADGSDWSVSFRRKSGPKSFPSPWTASRPTAGRPRASTACSAKAAISAHPPAVAGAICAGAFPVGCRRFPPVARAEDRQDGRLPGTVLRRTMKDEMPHIPGLFITGTDTGVGKTTSRR